jgi:hypothetical protein
MDSYRTRLCGYSVILPSLMIMATLFPLTASKCFFQDEGVLLQECRTAGFADECLANYEKRTSADNILLSAGGKSAFR